MARAASVSLSGGAKSAVLSRVFFLQPLVLDGDLSTLAIGIDINAAEERFDVVTEGVFLEKGDPIRVIAIEGQRVVVRKA